MVRWLLQFIPIQYIINFRAIKVGVCGVPSYQVNDGAVLWGQDRLNVVADLLCGWKDPVQYSCSKL